MAAKLNLDKLDYQIIQHMMEDAEISYADLGKKLQEREGEIITLQKKVIDLYDEKVEKLRMVSDPDDDDDDVFDDDFDIDDDIDALGDFDDDDFDDDDF